MLKQGDMATMDFKPERYGCALSTWGWMEVNGGFRLNVHVADDGTVTHVKMG